MPSCRMISSLVVSENNFLSMPFSAQALYYQLCLSADDEGFVLNTTRITKTLGVTKKIVNILSDYGFIIYFRESDVSVITHWNKHNRLKRSKPTICYKEKNQLCIVDNCYHLSTEIVDNHLNLSTPTLITPRF